MSEGIMSSEELAFQKELGKFEASLAGLIAAVQELKSEMSTRLDKVGNLLDIGGARMTEIESKLLIQGKDCENCRAGMNREITSLKDRVEKIEAKPEKNRASYTAWMQTIVITLAVIASLGGWKLLEAVFKK
jgi:hypothetical protein